MENLESMDPAIKKIWDDLKENQVYINSSGRRFEINKLDETTVNLNELDDIGNPIGARIWPRKTFAQAIRNKTLDKSWNKKAVPISILKSLGLRDLMRE